MITIFRTILILALIAKMVLMVVMVVMEYYDMATNMFIIGVYGKIRKNQSHP